MAGRKTFTAGEVLQAADVNDFLMDQAVMVFDDSAARGSAIPSPSEGMVTYLKDTNEVEKYDGSAFVAVSQPGILQVVSTNKTDTFSASTVSGSVTDVTGLSVSITPTSASSKVLVMWSVSGFAADVGWATVIKRDGSAIGTGASDGSRTPVADFGITFDGSGDLNMVASAHYLDSPATTSSITYQVALLNQRASTQSIGVNIVGNDGNFAYIARSSSTITLMEVAG